MNREFFFGRRGKSERLIGIPEVHFGKSGKKFRSAFPGELGGAEIDLFSGAFGKGNSSQFSQILQTAQKSGAGNDGGCGDGHVAFGLAALFQLITLPVEFNASRRALAALESSGRFSDTDLKNAGKTLRAAALTYVAALAVALANLLRIIVIVGGRNRRD